MLARNLQLYKIEVIHRTSSRILVEYSTGSFTDSHFQVESLLNIFCGTKITLIWTTQPFLDLPHPIFQYFEDSITLICKWEGRDIKLWMVDQQGALRLISSWDHCQRFSPSQISKITNHYNKVIISCKTH